MTEPPPAAIVLAAGGSKRLGQPKQLVRLAGEPLVRRAARMAIEAGCSPVVVVLGAAEAGCRRALAGLQPAPHVVVNERWQEGMSGSLRVGLGELESALGDARLTRPQSALMLVCDQVRLTTAGLEELVRVHASGDWLVTAARYGGRLGVPAIFRAELWPELARLSGDQGARRLLEQLLEQSPGRTA
ncbi:MAG TPA: nucleotidyltransferase family protein, partial [Acidobacteriaceae bacterium]